MSLAGKTALITGSNSGIGLEIARSLSKSGCQLMLNGVALFAFLGLSMPDFWLGIL